MSRNRWGAFTLIEMLVVIAIIAILAALLMPMLSAARERAKQVKCKNNMHTFMLGIEMYKQAYEDFTPPWLSAMYPVYSIATPEALICPDDSSRGAEGGIPKAFTSATAQQFPETDDTAARDAEVVGMSGPDADQEREARKSRNTAITHCSYIFEFTRVKCSWWNDVQEDKPGHKWADFDNDGFVSWIEAKQTEMKGLYFNATAGKVESNSAEAYGGGVPIVRCFWHARPGKDVRKEIAFNLACENGNVYNSTAEGDGWKNYLKGSH